MESEARSSARTHRSGKTIGAVDDDPEYGAVMVCVQQMMLPSELEAAPAQQTKAMDRRFRSQRSLFLRRNFTNNPYLVYSLVLVSMRNDCLNK